MWRPAVPGAASGSLFKAPQTAPAHKGRRPRRFFPVAIALLLAVNVGWTLLPYLPASGLQGLGGLGAGPKAEAAPQRPTPPEEGEGEPQVAGASEEKPEVKVRKLNRGGGAGAGARQHLTQGLGDAGAKAEREAEERLRAAAEDRPLELKKELRDLLNALRRQPVLLSRKLLNRKGSNTPISCGGTGTVTFRKWGELANAHPELNHSLPINEPNLAVIARTISGKCRENVTQCQEQDLHDEIGHRSKPTCAVVGNSGKLRYEFHRESIDSNEVVLRFNSGKIKNFEQNVGTKSTFRMYNGPYVEAKHGGEVTIAQMRDLAIRQWVKSYKKHADTLAFVMNPEFLCHAWTWIHRAGTKPSSGLIGIIMAIKMCKLPVNVYGFQYDGYFNHDLRPHYYDWERPKKGREHVHPFRQESDLFQRLMDAQLLRLY